MKLSAQILSIAFVLTFLTVIGTQTGAEVSASSLWTASRPNIVKITPSSGPIGTRITIYGTGFDKSVNKINFAGKKSVSILPARNGKITFVVPATPCPEGIYCAQQVLPAGKYRLSVTVGAIESREVVFRVTGSKTVTPIPPSPGPVAPAYFSVMDNVKENNIFVIELRDAAKIAHARELIANPSRQRSHVIGTVVKESRDYNRPWSFHLDPASIDFFETAVEVCDASASMVEEHLDEVGGAFLPDGRWCPWGSKLVDELPARRLLPSGQ